MIHPFIIAELALGSVKERTKTLALLDLLPQVRVAQVSEVRLTIEARRLYNRGIGLIDAHLVASVFINPSTVLWTRDKRLDCFHGDILLLLLSCLCCGKQRECPRTPVVIVEVALSQAVRYCMQHRTPFIRRERPKESAPPD